MSSMPTKDLDELRECRRHLVYCASNEVKTAPPSRMRDFFTGLNHLDQIIDRNERN